MFVLTGVYKSKRPVYVLVTTVLIKFNQAEIISKLKLNRAIDFERNTNIYEAHRNFLRTVCF